jgi:CSLREA domain-containing protein
LVVMVACVLVAWVALTSVALAGPAPSAATLRVTTTADELTSGDGACSLREAIAAANSPGSATDCGTASSTSNTIVLPAGHYALSIPATGADDNSSGDLNVTGHTPLTVSGAGLSATIVDATGLGDRVLSIATGASLTVQRLEISGGHAPAGAAGANGGGLCADGGNGSDAGSPGAGGGVYNAGTLSLVGVGVVGNTAGAGGAGGASGGRSCPTRGGNGGSGADGGGVYNAGTLTATNSTILNNIAGGGGPGGAGFPNCDCSSHHDGGDGGPGGAGGGIYNAGSAAKLTVTNSTIAGNRGGDGGGGGHGTFLLPGFGGRGGRGGGGGGVANHDGTLVVSGSTIAGNNAGAGGGGGGYSGGGGAGAWGGGIYAAGGFLQVTNSTLAGNDPGTGGGGGVASNFLGGHGGNGGNGGDGGAIATAGLSSTSRVRNATVTNNAAGAGGPGGGGTHPGSGGTAGNGGGLADSTALTVQNTIVASNNANGAANCYPSSGVAAGGHDLSYGDASCPGGNGNPGLLALSDYGGPTQTMALGPGSAGLGGVPATGAGCPKTDQRGVKRPDVVGTRCDIGAFEFAAPTVTISTPPQGAQYQQGQVLLAAYRCSEGGIKSPIRACSGTVTNGQPIDTSSPGTHSFTVTATDKAGNQATKTIHYTVT